MNQHQDLESQGIFVILAGGGSGSLDNGTFCVVLVFEKDERFWIIDENRLRMCFLPRN